MGKFITITLFLLILVEGLSIVFSSSVIIKYLEGLSLFLFTTGVFIINPILNYIKSDDNLPNHIEFKQHI